jgi:hypothetical protein
MTPVHCRFSGAEASGEKGAALIIALLVAVLLGALAAGAITIAMTDTLIADSHRAAHEAACASEAALDRALHDLAALADWSLALAPPPANVVSTFNDGRTVASAPDGRRLDLIRLTVDRQADSDSRDGPFLAPADRPQWRLYAHAPIADLPVDGPAGPPAYLIVWVADDADGDGDPLADGNSQVLVRAEAYGIGARRGVEAAIRRGPGAVVQVLARRAME